MWVFGLVANGDQGDQEHQVPAFKEYGLSELRKATNGFSSDHIVSESGEKAPNVVYRGKLDSNRLVAVKRFSKQSWPDAQQFVVRKKQNPIFSLCNVFNRKDQKMEEKKTLDVRFFSKFFSVLGFGVLSWV